MSFQYLSFFFLNVNYIFRCTIVLNVRPFGVFFICLLILFLYDSYFETRDYSTYSLTYREEMDELYTLFQDLRNGLIMVKQESPSAVRFSNITSFKLFSHFFYYSLHLVLLLSSLVLMFYQTIFLGTF